MSFPRGQVALGILAGGQARRLGGADKAFALLDRQTLLARTLAALGDGYAATLISYNGASAERLPSGLHVVPDLRPAFPGPLAGIESLLTTCRSGFQPRLPFPRQRAVAAESRSYIGWLLTVPVDLEVVPGDLLERLSSASVGTDGVYAVDADGEQPLVALWPVASSMAPVSAALDAGERAVHRVQDILGFGTCALSPLRLGNLNTPADFDAGT